MLYGIKHPDMGFFVGELLGLCFFEASGLDGAKPIGFATREAAEAVIRKYPEAFPSCFVEEISDVLADRIGDDAGDTMDFDDWYRFYRQGFDAGVLGAKPRPPEDEKKGVAYNIGYENGKVAVRLHPGFKTVVSH